MVGKKYRHILLDEDITIEQVANKVGTSVQNVSQKLRRDNLRESEMIELADAVGYDVKIEFVKRQ